MDDVTIDLSTNDLDMNDVKLKDGRPIKSKRKKSYMIPIVVLAVVAVIVLFVKLDIGKISSKYIAPKIENIPFINKILPNTKQGDGLYDSQSKKQLIDIISGSETELEIAQMEIEDHLDRISDLEKKIKDLEVFEDEYLKFKEEKQIFDDYIGNMEKEEFIKFYEQMNPENAQTIYAELVKVQQMTKEQRKYSALISEMDETSAAKVLENLFQTDMDIILSILSNMDTESASAILGEMDSKIASMVVKQLSPE
ncbi:MAG TPA: hypothetical protein GX707_02420 [Epulopiscium sp.]|nr:hypothetical protein [Candidatus Epulonipiscium sp.]